MRWLFLALVLPLLSHQALAYKPCGDYPDQTVLLHGFVLAQAQQQAAGEGLSGQALRDRINALMTDPSSPPHMIGAQMAASAQARHQACLTAASVAQVPPGVH
jgi:hypothetical protein